MKYMMLVFILLASCSLPKKDIEITYITDIYGVPVPVVNGVPYALTPMEVRAIAQKFVNAYCPVR